MSTKNLIFAAILASFALGLSAIAQEQSQGPVLGSSAASIDNQGIRNYLLGPGDVLDVRVFGQSDLSSQVEIDADGNISSLPFLETPIRAQCRDVAIRSEEHTSELQSRGHLVCRLLLEKKKQLYHP